MGIERDRHIWVRLTRYAVRLVLVVTVSVGAAAWYASGQLLEIRRAATHYDVQILRLGRGTVTLQRTEKTALKGIWGLEGDGGYAQVGRIVSVGRSQVTREFRLLQGNFEVGQRVAVDPWAFPGDPAQAIGIPFSDVEVPSELGQLPAWYVSGPRDTWVIFVHGRDASRREALRMLKPVVDLGFPSLVITYRNDLEAPRSPDALYHLGETEWKDADSAASYALDHGAEHLVMVGFSMGGAIVSEFLHRSAHVSSVVGVVFDAPVLDWGATVNLVGRDHGVPGPLMSLTKSIFSMRFEARWRELNEMEGGARLLEPVLLFHGTADTTVPVETSDALAAARPDLVTYVRVGGAGHVEAWNLAPARYEPAVRGFLSRIAP